MFKWEVKAETHTKANPKNIWKIWTDVSSWPTWDNELEWSKLNGPFKVGTEGELKPKGWPSSKFVLTSVEEHKSHSDKTRLPFTEVNFYHHLLSVSENEVKIVHHVKVAGLLAPLLWFTMRRTLKKGMPIAVNKLARLAESIKNE